jgi:hypothetical protein
MTQSGQSSVHYRRFEEPEEKRFIRGRGCKDADERFLDLSQNHPPATRRRRKPATARAAPDRP